MTILGADSTQGMPAMFSPEPFVFQFAIHVYKIYRIIIVPFFLYGCKTWSLTPRAGQNYNCTLLFVWV